MNKNPQPTLLATTLLSVCLLIAVADPPTAEPGDANSSVAAYNTSVLDEEFVPYLECNAEETDCVPSSTKACKTGYDEAEGAYYCVEIVM